MRFSVTAGPRQRVDLGQTTAEAMREFIDDALLAEELEFDAFTVGEHHFTFASGNSSPLMFLAAVASRTKRIRLGAGVICAPFHNPLRLAEDIAALDIISNGRFDLGIGVGSQLEEFRAFHIDPKERFGRTWEIIDILELCLNSGKDEVEYQGKYYSFPKVQWIMQPVQKRIPIYWGGFGPQGVRRAAERGYHLIASDYTGTYERTMRELGRDPRKYDVGFAHIVCVAHTKEQAIAVSAEPCAWVSNQYALRPTLDGEYPPKSHAFDANEIAAIARGGKIPSYLERTPGQKPPPFSVPIVGTARDVLEALLPIARGERGLITHISIGFHEPGMKPAAVHRSMRLFAGEIMPVLRGEAARHGL